MSDITPNPPPAGQPTPMPADPAALLLDRLADSGLVPPDPLADLRAWAAATHPGVGQLVQAVVDRGLLTRFQVREVAAGRAAGLTVGPYRLLDLLGEGGMGRVFQAVHLRLGRPAAVKLIRPERLGKASAVGRFRQEVRAAARLHHPNVVLAFDADEADGVHYFAMEYVPGRDLQRVVEERGPLPVAEAVGYARQAAAGLHHAAELGLVHRDVKPANLLLTPAGEVKLLDLGLALLDAGRGDGQVVGSPDYLAPEQATNPLGVDGRADVYGLGGTLFFLLTGNPPVDGASVGSKLVAHVRGDPPSLLAHRPDAPPALDAVVRWMLNKRPAERPQSAAAAAHALAPFAAELPPTTATPVVAAPRPPEAFPAFDTPAVGPPRPAPTPKPSRMVRGPLYVAAGLVALLGLGLVVWRAGTTAGLMPPTLTNSVGMTLVRLPGGPVTLGSPPGELGRRADEPQTEGSVPGPFYAAATETTHGQYLAVMGTSPARWAGKVRQPGAFPVESVTADEAAEFCRRLTARDKPARPGWVYRLPTGAEWEYACRAGTPTAFWAGDKLSRADGVFDPAAPDPAGLAAPGGDPERGLPHAAGRTRANPFGLHDTCGNVWEWTTDAAGGGRAVRGGSWRSPPADCRSAARKVLDPATRADDVGFRVVYARGGPGS